MKKNVISFINMKGGVGKTTLCKEMATYLADTNINGREKPYKILLIDIDPQSNLTQSLDERYNLGIADAINKKEELKKKGESITEIVPSIQNIFTPPEAGNIYECSIKQITDNLTIVPGELETIFLERSKSSTTSNKLLDFIEDYKLRDKFDFIFIDCPPTYSIYTEMATFCSDFYFIPVVPDAYSSLGVNLLEKVMADIVKENRNTVFQNKKIKNLGVIFTRVDLKNKPKQQDHMDALKESDTVIENNIYIFKNEFKESNKTSTASFDKLIRDREDKKLLSMLEDICLEFIKTWEEAVDNESK